LLTQQLTRAFEKDGVTGAAKIVAGILTSEPEQAKGLEYRLFQTAERKGWTQEAYAYNSLVISWPEIQNKAAELMVAASSAEQLTLFDLVHE
jgi:putative DNA methylase